MRILDFVIKKQILEKDPACDFSGLESGTKGYIHARFSFSQEWSGCGKIAVFESGGEKIPVKLDKNMCGVPESTLMHKKIKIYVIGVKPGYRIVSRTVEVRQND